MVYDVKADLSRKARLVVMGDVVNPRGLSTRAKFVKGISVRLLNVIAHRYGLKMLCGDIGHAFIQTTTRAKIFTRCGPEFGDKSGCIAIIEKALCGLTTSAERLRTMLGDFLRGMGFVPTRYDRDVWMRCRESIDGYDYICTHVDDFKIVSTNPDRTFVVKSVGPHYLGNDFRWEKQEDLWTTGCKKY